MPALGFKKQFTKPIRDGLKHTTIRVERKKNPIRVGDILHMYTGMRTKQCEKIGVYRCTSVRPIVIYPKDKFITLDGYPCSKLSIQDIVHTDGFSNIADFFAFFDENYGVTPPPMVLIGFEPV